MEETPAPIHSGIKWRTSAIAKHRPLAPKGQTYLHLKINTKYGAVVISDLVGSGQSKEAYNEMAETIYNNEMSKYE